MTRKIQVPITDNVADTLFIPLYMRSLETERPDGIINDPLSCELVQRLDYDFSKYGKAKGSQVGTAIRIRRFDRAVSRFVEDHADPVVVNIGAGLDTRFHRVYKGKGFFYDLDLPEVVEFRKQLLPESENNTYLSVSMFDTNWIGELIEKHPEADFILIAEGVFMYFEEQRIKSLIVEIAERFGRGQLHFDVSSPWAARNSHKHDTVKYSNATFKWGLENDLDIESWSPKLHFVEADRYLTQEKGRWGMLGVLGRILPKYRNAFRMLHYDIAV